MTDDRGLAALAERLHEANVDCDYSRKFDRKSCTAGDGPHSLTAATILGDSGRFSPDGGLDAQTEALLAVLAEEDIYTAEDFGRFCAFIQEEARLGPREPDGGLDAAWAELRTALDVRGISLDTFLAVEYARLTTPKEKQG